MVIWLHYSSHRKRTGSEKIKQKKVLEKDVDSYVIRAGTREKEKKWRVWQRPCGDSNISVRVIEEERKSEMDTIRSQGRVSRDPQRKKGSWSSISGYKTGQQHRDKLEYFHIFGAKAPVQRLGSSKQPLV